jgi:GNAT superfamily N-acetyltransferase
MGALLSQLDAAALPKKPEQILAGQTFMKSRVTGEPVNPIDRLEADGLIAAIGRMSKIAEGGKVLVAAVGSEIHGAVGYVPPGFSNPKIFPRTWPSMRMLVVPPSRRGMGTGKRLSEACVQHAKDDGATCIGLHTSEIMTVALPMYLRMGFVKDADLPPIAGAPYARYVLRF